MAVSHFGALARRSTLLPLLFAANTCCTGPSDDSQVRAWLISSAARRRFQGTAALSTQMADVEAIRRSRSARRYDRAMPITRTSVSYRKSDHVGADRHDTPASAIRQLN